MISASTSSTLLQASGGSGNQSSPLSSCYQNLNLNQVIHPELIESFFHQLVRRLMKEEKFKDYMEADQLM
jgi:hypothetical protein